MQLMELEHYTRALLDTARFQDYCPNGLQIQGRSEVRKIVTGVSANLALIKAAIDADADAILVHHGYFWRNENPCIVGVKQARIKLLLEHNISLFGFHLPLDAHPALGNNAQLAQRLGFEIVGWAGEQGLIAHGALTSPFTLGELENRISAQLGRAPLIIGDAARTIRRIAWCSGGAQGYFETAAALGVDAYLTGEASEQNAHYAQEAGVAFIAAGHHATERYGIQALGEHLAAAFGLKHEYKEILNPI